MCDSVLTVEIKPGEILHIDKSRIRIELVKKSGQVARLKFHAEENIDIKKENKCNKDT